ncbi:type II secretion system F family protein [Woodsholea maritima]|uniref:type II secretion system F family protein n=1 Tax=Woodsholea maritima TaxID=240237 RepID=UPI0003641E86|nr:type II secretion system F family protein [Woodsholea maritima]
MGYTEFAEFITNPGTLFALIAAVLVFATILTLTKPLMGGDSLDKRIKAVHVRREELRRKSREAIDNAHKPQNQRLRGDQGKGLYRNVVEKLNLQKLLEDPDLKDKLVQAGLRGQGPIFTFYFFRLASPFILWIGSGLYLSFINDFGLPGITRWSLIVGIGICGYYAPNIYLSNAAQKRRDSIMRAFPDALDLLLICVEAGMSIEAAFQKVSGEIGSNSIELAEELSQTTAELSYLQDRRQAYDNLARRTNHPGVKSVATALIQAERYGTPMGQALRVMAKENRDMRMAQAEKKAAALPAQLTVPMILFFLPVIFVVILGPAILTFPGL